MKSAYELAQAEVGTVEWSKGANPKVMAYFKDAGHAEVSDETVSELVRAGLWIERARHIEIRDYLDYQKDAETIRKEREMARQRKARSRRKVDEPPPDLEQRPPDGADFGG